MFWRMLVKAAILRRGRALSALLAMTVAAAVATAMLTLYSGVQQKLQAQFRGYGANVILSEKGGGEFSAGRVAEIESALVGRATIVPFGYVIGRTSDGKSVVVCGTDFAQARAIDTWWSVSAWPSGQGQALVGTKAFHVVTPGKLSFTLSFQGRTIQLMPAGTVTTGAVEDSRVFISLGDFQNWTGLGASTLELAVSGSTQEVNDTMHELNAQFPDIEVRPVRQLVEGQARVLGKTRSTIYASSLLIIVTAALCVLSTLVGWVFDRRADFAIMKALGGSERLIAGFFAAESAALGIVGAIVGFAGGTAIAAWIGRANFHAAIAPRLTLFPEVLVGSILVTLVAAIVPITLLRQVEPAMILKGE